MTPEHHQITVTDAERELLAAFARGGKDEIVARRIGIATRTLQRRMLNLMTRLGATSRLQVGVLAAQAGWVTPDNSRHSRDHRA